MVVNMVLLPLERRVDIGSQDMQMAMVGTVILILT